MFVVEWECWTEDVSECRRSQTYAVCVNVGRVVFGQKVWGFFGVVGSEGLTWLRALRGIH